MEGADQVTVVELSVVTLGVMAVVPVWMAVVSSRLPEAPVALVEAQTRMTTAPFCAEAVVARTLMANDHDPDAKSPVRAFSDLNASASVFVGIAAVPS